jgi:hypothetical protein
MPTQVIEARYPDIVRVVKADASQFLATHRGEPSTGVDTSHLYEPTLNELMPAGRKPGEGGDDWIASVTCALRGRQAVRSFAGPEIVVAGADTNCPAPRHAASPRGCRRTRGAPDADATQQRLRRVASQSSLSFDIPTSASTKFPPSLSASLTRAKPQGIVATVRDLAGARQRAPRTS